VESGNHMWINSLGLVSKGRLQKPFSSCYIMCDSVRNALFLCRNIFFVRPTFCHSLVFSCVYHSKTL
jgi:hypothetical protein